MDQMDGIKMNSALKFLNQNDKWWCHDELLRSENLEEAANLILQSPSAVENYAMFRNDSHQKKLPVELTATFTVPRSLDQTFNQDNGAIQWKIGELVIPNNGELNKLQIFVPFEKNGTPAFLKNAIPSAVSEKKVELKPVKNEVTESVEHEKDGTDIGGDSDLKIQPDERYMNTMGVIEAIYDPIEVKIKPETEMVTQEQNETWMPSAEMNNKPVLKNTGGMKRKQGFATETAINYEDSTPLLSPQKGLPYKTKLAKPISLGKSALVPKMIQNDDWDIDESPSWNSSDSDNTKTGESYNFFCLYCYAGFYQNYKIKNHVKIHKGRIVYKCMCGKCGIPYRDFRTMTKYHNAMYK